MGVGLNSMEGIFIGSFVDFIRKVETQIPKDHKKYMWSTTNSMS